VTSTADTNATGTLRHCLSNLDSGTAANKNSITFSVTGTITLASPLPDIANGVTITGPGANKLTIKGGGAASDFSVLTVNSGISAVLSGITISNGNHSLSGGGIANAGNLTVANSAIISNTTGVDGGGIFNDTGTLTVLNSTIANNTAKTRGGGGISSRGTTTISTSTLTGNLCQDGGCGISSTGTVIIVGSTISGNGNTTNVLAGGVRNNGGTLTLGNTIVAGNTASAVSPDADIDPVSAFTDNGGNQVGTSATGTSNLDPKLSSLQYNGTGTALQTMTMIPLPGSPAICAGFVKNITGTTDQRGFPNTNTTYPGYSTSNKCVDAGAVQTNYAMSFTTQPPSVLVIDQSFGAQVTLNESGAPFKTVSIPILLSLSSGTLYSKGVLSPTGATANTTNGIANYSGLSASLGTDVQLVATMPLNPALTPSLSLAKNSNSFTIDPAPTVVAVTPASQTSTVDSAVTFTATVSVNKGSLVLVPVSQWLGMKGSVTFANGGSTITDCSGPGFKYDSSTGTGQATCTNSSLPAGTLSITASYANDTNYGDSQTSKPVTVNMNPAGTSLRLVPTPSPSTSVNQEVTFTATVTPASAAVPLKGIVTFTDNGNPIDNGSNCGTAGVVNITPSTGTAACKTSKLTGGNHSIVASYDDGSNPNYNPSNNNVTQKVNPVPTTVAMPTVSPSSPVTDQPFTISATVSTPNQAVPFSGAMQFKNGTATIGCSPVTVDPTTGVALCQIPNGLAAGSYSITAQYNVKGAGTADLSYQSSQLSSPLTLNVGKGSISITVTSSAAAPAPTVNQPVTFAASITAGQPIKAKVSFSDNGTVITGCGSQTLSSDGIATCTDSSLTATTSGSPHVIVATYAGDANYPKSTGTLSGGQAVNQGSTSLALTSSNSTSTVNGSVTFTATITPNPLGSTQLGGKVAFFDTPDSGSQVLISGCEHKTVTIATGQATCTTSPVTVGKHTIIATYGGPTNADTNFAESSNTPFTQTVNPATSAIKFVSTPINPAVNQEADFPITIPFTKNITTLAGKVTFTDNGNPIVDPRDTTKVICTNVQPNSDGGATCQNPYFTQGAHTVRASYQGDPNVSVSDATVNVTVAAASSTVASVTSNPDISTISARNQGKFVSVTFTAAVNPFNATQPLSANGKVSFSVNGSPLICSSQAFAASNGTATCTAQLGFVDDVGHTSNSILVDGANTIVASYTKDSNYLPSSGNFSSTVQDYSIGASNVPPDNLGLQITQGYTSSSDPFPPDHLISVSPLSIANYKTTGPAILRCKAFQPDSSGNLQPAPALGCLPAGTSSAELAIQPGNVVQQSINITLDATSTNPGTYTIIATAVDNSTSLTRTTTFPVTVRAKAKVNGGTPVVSGSTASGKVTFTLPPGVTITSIPTVCATHDVRVDTCPRVVGTGISEGELNSIGMAISFGDSTLGDASSKTTQSVSTTATITTNNQISFSTPPTVGNRSTTLLYTGLVCLPFLGLLGLARGRKSFAAHFLRTLAIVAVALAGLQVLGCGGSFTPTGPTHPSGTTPPGSYSLKVQATGSDKNTYEAVLQVNVSL
jgi:hypothetical protein